MPALIYARPRMAYPAARMSEAGGWGPASRRFAAALVSRFNSPLYRPPVLPPVATRLIELSEADEIDLDAVINLLSNDSLLAGRILRLVQSPLYRPVAPVRSLREAVLRLGVHRVRDFVMADVLHLRLLRTPHWRNIMERVRLHSLAVAQISEALARIVGATPEEAFLCGLMHDVGVAGCVILASEDARLAEWMSPSVAIPVIEELHAEAGAIIGSLWKLPPAVREVMAFHHLGEPGTPGSLMNAIVCVADAIATDLGAGLALQDSSMGIVLREQTHKAPLAESMFFLGLTSTQMQSLRADSSDLIDSIALLDEM